MMRKSVFMIAILTVLVVTTACGGVGADGENWPERPVKIVVGWEAGGSSDIAARAMARELEKELNTTFQVTNVKGANGGIAGGQVARDPADGYTVLGGASVHGTWPVMEQADVSWEDYYSFIIGSFPTTVYVAKNSPYKTLDDLLGAIEQKQGNMKYGTTGPGGNGDIFANLLLKKAGLAGKAEAIPYNGGREAGQYLRSGDVDFIAVTLGDTSDLAVAGEIRPITNLYPRDMKYEGITFPSVLKKFPELEPYLAINPSFGLYLPRETPTPVVKKFSDVFLTSVKTARFKKDFVEERGGVLEPAVGQKADEVMSRVESARSWPLYEMRIAPINPSDRGIPRIEKWSWPPHERAKQVKPWPKGVDADQ